jgi:hypothetical protein
MESSIHCFFGDDPPLAGRVEFTIQDSFKQAAALVLRVRKVHFQLVAERHQFINLGNDAALFGSCPTYIMEVLPSATCIRYAISRLPLSLLAARFGDPSGGPAIPLAMEPTVKPIEVHCGDHGASGAASAGYNQYG